MYTTLNEHYRQRFGCKVYKLALDAGFTCPNRDGTLATDGCIFCSASGGGEFAEKTCGSVSVQLQNAKTRVQSKIKDGKFIAYFQSFSNTYAPVSVLEPLYRSAMEADDIAALAIAARPDCLPDDVLALLARLNQEKPVYVELGLQTIHPNTVRYIRRGYENDIYFHAVRALKQIGIHVVTHIIIGLPGESCADAVETTRQAVAAGTDGVKFHLLHVLRGTDLEQEYLAGRFRCLTMEEYGEQLSACLAVLPDHIVVHRMTGDGAKRDLIAPLWSADKKRVLNYLNQVIHSNLL
ncbi:MAG: TIGR01212 family radical SAM protein [Oscillospiraceae bacterium]|nr:TIGR01212 family radical SAM protein [Oscillospiraceae bacterium]